jgi:hypothetical protein
MNAPMVPGPTIRGMASGTMAKSSSGFDVISERLILYSKAVNYAIPEKVFLE